MATSPDPGSWSTASRPRSAAWTCHPGSSTGRQLPETIFTPATKAELGDHDENVTFDEVVAAIGQRRGADAAPPQRARLRPRRVDRADRGLILADTKFEFGSAPTVARSSADEVLTPDSSRFWPADEWEPGHAQPSFDKQYVRDWLTSPACGWDRPSGEAPPPLPDEVVDRTRSKYVEAYEQLTGKRFT